MLMSIEESARYLGLQPSTLRRWAYERKLSVVKLGRRVLIRQEVLDELIKRGERPALRPYGREGRREGER